MVLLEENTGSGRGAYSVGVAVLRVEVAMLVVVGFDVGCDSIL